MDDARTTEELFAASLQGECEDEAAWEAVRALQRRGTAEVFEFAKERCAFEDPKVRARALDVLAQLGAGKPESERPFREQCVPIAINHLSDNDPMVIRSAAWALAHLQGIRAVAALIDVRDADDPDTRHAVALGMQGCTEPEAIATLIELMGDPSDKVRDWATFALGTQCDEDSLEIREALRKRLEDPFPDARSEAIWGLAKRKDPLGLKFLLDRLKAQRWVQGDEDAAADLLELNRDVPIENLRNGLQGLLAQTNHPARP